MVLRLGIFELDVQAVLDANIHLDGTVDLRRDTVRVDPDILLTDDIGHTARDSNADVVAKFDIDAVVRLVLLLDVLEVEIKCLRVLKLAGGRKLLDERQKLVMIASVEEHFWRQGVSRCCIPLPVIDEDQSTPQRECIPMLPMNCTLIPVCSRRFPSLGRTVTAPLTDSPSMYSGAFSRRFLSSLTSTICLSSAFSRTMSMSTGVEKK